MTIVMSFCGLCVLLAAGKFLRAKVRLFQRLYLPASVIGGLLGLLIIQLVGKHILAGWTAGWNKLPGFLINIVFAALFLGVTIPPLSSIWRTSAPQLAYGQIVAWGQYVVGIGLVLVLLRPLFGMPDLFGVIIPVGFEGGHGTAGGLRDVFTRSGWEAGGDYALASATVGIISAVVVGMALINWAARRGIVTRLKRFDHMTPEEQAGMYPPAQRPSAGLQTASPNSIDSLALHLAVIGLAILIGYAIQQALVKTESLFPAMQEKQILAGFPLFPLCMIGGLIVQLVFRRAARISPIDHGLMQRLGGTALDFLVVAAMSTIRVSVIARGLAPFLLAMIAGILWNVFCALWLAKRLLPNFWFERAMAELGQSMGVTATGLLLLRAVDPEGETDAPAAFGYKQLLHEPFMGGGLWTSSAIPLILWLGPGIVLAISGGGIATWLIVWALLLRDRQPG
ncbi:MAG: sodium:glutamate symporter [Kiritimatiellae bacterium]|nr:sodium:glutamate symporter [Kiritimatiellia bacterium]